MKKLLLFCTSMVVLTGFVRAQCVPTCSNYITLPITFSVTAPAGNTISATAFSPNGDDGYTAPIQIGFNFNYYCTTYSTVLVYSNGLLQFDIGAPSTFPLGYDAAQSIPNFNTPTILNGIVCFKMDDLDPSVGGIITYTTLGLAPNRSFVLTYSNVPVFGNPSLLNTGQIILYETSNEIDIVTVDAPLSPNLATQGIENELGTVATAVPGRNQSNWFASNSAYRFIPVTPAPPTPVSGSQVVCEGTQNLYTSATAAAASSYTWALPSGWSGTGTTTALNTIAGASGNLSVAAVYTCGTSSAATISVSVTPAPVVTILAALPTIICAGSSFTIAPSGANSYSVFPGPTVGSGQSDIVVTSFTSGTYTLVGSDNTNCLSYNAATVEITTLPTPTVTVNSGSICTGKSFTIQPSGGDTYQVNGGFLTVTPSTPGVFNYSVVGIGIGGNQCPSILPAISSLSVYATPTVVITTPRTVVCKNEAIVLTATGADTYNWTNNGMTAAAITVSLTANTNFTAVGTSSAGCVSSKVLLIVVSPCSAIGENNAGSSAISIYPNPGTGVFTLEVASAQEGVEAELYSSTGQLILTRRLENGTTEIDITQQADGLYYVKLKGDSAPVLKIVKQ